MTITELILTKTLAPERVVKYLLTEFDVNWWNGLDINTRSQAHEQGLYINDLIFWPHKEDQK